MAKKQSEKNADLVKQNMVRIWKTTVLEIDEIEVETRKKEEER